MRFRRKLRASLTALGFILPNVCGFLVFTSIPVVASLLLSLYAWDTFSPAQWVGLGNFAELLGFMREDGRLVASDPEFWYSCFNTVFLMLGIPVGMALSLTLAILLNRKLRSERVLAGQGWAAIQFGAGGVAGLLIALVAALAGLRLPACLGIGLGVWLLASAGLFALLRTPPAWGMRLRDRGWTVLRVLLGAGVGLLVAILVGAPREQWALGLSLGLIGGVALALALGRAIVTARAVFFLPSVTAGVAIYLMWIWLLNPHRGPINEFLGVLGIQGPEWLSGGFQIATETGARVLWFWAKPAMMMMGTWIGMGGTNMILYLAALQGIDPQLYEAAEIDGAGPWQKFLHVTLPLLAPTTFFIAVMSVIYGFQGGFNAAYVMTGGGPEGSTTTISYYIFRQAFEFFQMGYAAAVAWVLFGVVFVCTVLVWRWRGKGEVY